MRNDPKALLGREILNAQDFAQSPMVCPGCYFSVSAPVEQCPRCHFSGKRLVDKYVFDAPDLERYVDPHGYLPERSRGRIDQVLDDLESDFPQVRISICIVDLLAEVDPREFGFWFFNASKVYSETEAQRRAWTVLLALDDQNARASVTKGYGIEPFLSDANLEELLWNERELFLEKEYEAGVFNFVEGLEELLESSAARAEKILKKRRRFWSRKGGRR